MHYATSADGTKLAYDRSGSGPAVVLVGGATVTRKDHAALAAELAVHCTVYNYDRRGRGDSGDTLPFSLSREIEDIGALIDEAGGAADLYGISSGGGLVLEAAAAGLPARRLAVYEVPYNMAPSAAREQAEYVARLQALLAEDRRGDAFALFMGIAGADEEMIEQARNSEFWPGCEALAHTLVYDAAALGDGQPSAERLATIDQPTLVATGGASAESFVGGGGSFFDDAADAIMASLPNGTRESVPGQTHMVDPAALAPVLARFFTG